MSNGGAQHKVYGPYWDALNATMYQSIWVQTFDAGAYTVAKDFWTNEDKNVSSPSNVVELQGGTNGTVAAYFDGDYAIQILASDKVTVITQYPSVKITSDTATMWEGNQTSGSYGAATAANVGQIKAKIAAGVFRGLALQEATTFVEFFTANAAGNQTIDTMVAKSYPWYDITHGDYGAVDGEAADQTSRIQAAVDAVELVGKGAILVNGDFQVDGTLDINNTSILWLGLGDGKSVLRQTVDPATPMIDYDTTDITDFFAMRGIDIVTTVAGSTSAIDLSWPSTAGEDSLRNCQFSDVYIGPTVATAATAYFTNNVTVNHAKKMDIDNMFLRGHNSLDTVATGLLLNGYTEFTNIKGLRCHHLLTGLETTTNVKNTKLAICEFKGQTQGVLLGGCEDFKITASTFEKEADSTVDWIGIKGDSLNIEITGGNSFKDLGSASGTDVGISLDTVVGGLIQGNFFDTLDTGVITTANTTGTPIRFNNFASVTQHITNVNASNPVDGNTPRFWEDVASASPLVGSNNTDFWNITGTTNFSSIDSTNAYEGREVYMEFNAALTIATGGNMKIPSTLSPTGPLDLMSLIYKTSGTKWLEKYYSANQ